MRRVGKSPPQEYTLIAHPGSIFQDGQYKFNFTKPQLEGFIAGLYVLESDQPDVLELYGPNNREINWEKVATGNTRRNAIILPVSNEEAFERDVEAILRHKTKRHVAILEMENAAYILQYDDVGFIDGLNAAFEEAQMNLEDYLREVPEEINR
jgi:hypothetical protein